MDNPEEREPGSAGSDNKGDNPTLLGRKSVLIGIAAAMGASFATQPSSAMAAVNAGTVKPIAASQPLYAPKWIPSTAYALGQQVISPNNDVVTANAAHSSSTTFTSDQAKWALSTTFASKATETTVVSGRLSNASLDAAFAKVVTPEYYGAVGDGTTDDKAAFDAMFVAIAGTRSRVYLSPDNTYRLASTVTVDGQHGLTLDGYGATVKADPNSAYNLFNVTNTNGLEVRGVYFNGGRVGPYRPFEWGNYGFRVRGSAVNVGFDGCTFSWFNDSCIKTEGENAAGTTHPTESVAKNLRIANCRFTDTYHIAMLGKYGTATGFVFSGNILTRVSGPVEIDGQALETAYTTGTGCAVISGNVWTDCAGDPGVESALIFIEENAYDIIVTGNVMRRITDLNGLHLDDGQTFKNYGRITVSNNIFEEFQNSSTTTPVANCNVINTRLANTSGLSLLRDFSIHGNKFVNTAGSAIYVSQVATAGKVSNLRVTDNEFIDVGCWGIINDSGNDMVLLSLLAQFENVKVSGNTFARRGSALKSYTWLKIVGTPAKSQGPTMVTDNLFQSPTDADPQATYINGVNRLIATGNTLDSCQFRVDATAGTFQANRMNKGYLAAGVAVASPAVALSVVGNVFDRGGSANDFGIKTMQAAVLEGVANILLGYTDGPVFLSSGTYKGTYQRALGVVTTL